MERKYLLLLTVYIAGFVGISVTGNEISFRECEPIRIEMCKNLGYNETSMPNLAGNEVQSEAEYTLQSFSPLIEYVCSSQLKLFLCATYVPMCTPKAPIPIGPCRNLCESVRFRCEPVLQGFGYNWPPALDCSLFPKENNQETMCMEGPGEAQELPSDGETLFVHSVGQDSSVQTVISTSSTFECPGLSKLYVKLLRSWRCAPLCEANILFGPTEKHVAEIWTNTLTYAALGFVLVAVILMVNPETKTLNSCNAMKTRILYPLLWCHTMVVVGWTVRLIAGRNATSCGFDPQFPKTSLLLVDGLSNGPCAATFILRYYFGMAASAWWAILCLGWHRDVRRNNPDLLGQVLMVGNIPASNSPTIKRYRAGTNKKDNSITSSNLARFLAWSLPAFQTAAVIVARLVDADELLGSCFVGNQSDKGLQILVATPLFCYWIFGSMNLASGFLVYRRNQEILRNMNLPSMRMVLQHKGSVSGSFLFIYCVACGVLLMAVIYEFANIDIWLNVSPYISTIKVSTILSTETPMWPFLTRAFMELMLAIICSAWISGFKISSIYKRQFSKSTVKPHQTSIQTHTAHPAHPAHPAPSSINSICRTSKSANSLVSYQSVRQPKNVHAAHVKYHQNSAIILKNNPSNSTGRINPTSTYPASKYINLAGKSALKSLHHYGDETIL